MSEERETEAAEKIAPEPDTIKGVKMEPGDQVTVGVVHYVTGTFRGTETNERGSKMVVIDTDGGAKTTSSSPHRKLLRSAIVSAAKS